VYGGIDDKNGGFVHNQLLCYNAKTQELSIIRPSNTRFTPGPLLGASLMYQPKNGGFLWLFGGMDQNERHQRIVWKFDLSTNTWERIHTRGINPIPRESHSAVYYKNIKGQEMMVVYGGFFVHNVDRYVDCQRDMLFLNLDSLEWSIQRFGGHYQIGRAYHSSVIFKDYLYVYGGYIRTGPDDDHNWERSRELSRFDFRTESWELLDSKFGEPRSSHRSAIVIKVYLD
jgi:N-acetylneuraminic acid mutarotase